MPQDPETARELGVLSTQIAALNKRLDGQDRTLGAIEDNVTLVLGYVNTQKGGIRMLVMLGSVAGAMGAGIAWAWTTFFNPHG